MAYVNKSSDDALLWYKDAVIYEIHVRAFRDGNADGIGDFIGLTQKLDYLVDLDVTAIWLLPFFPSPLKDDGYDIADYYSIHKNYGTLRNFKRFLSEAHKRELRVIAELVINHTSSDHPWFQKARRAPEGSLARDYYVWSKTSLKYKEARIIFKDFETSNWSYDPVADSYYWHRFYSHQPDLNFDNPEVREKVIDVLDYWFSLGVDGLRLDAIPYLFEREGTMCENLPETHQFLKKLRSYADQHFPGRILIAEANQWPEDAAAYFGDGTECHMAFHFPLMPRLFMAVRMEDSFPIVDILKSTPPIPENCQWAMFLRNHDELTLEMVTDEERDYMYRVYAEDPKMKINLGIRRRLTPLLGNNRRKIEMMNILLFSFPGTPVLYYGDEIGMGDNHFLGDRNGVRTPMQWNAGKNAGFSEANPQSLYLPTIIDPQYHYETTNVEHHRENPSSLLCWMQRVIAMRNRYKVFGRGDIRFVPTDNSKIMAFTRTWKSEQMLVVVNLSRFMQVVSLELRDYAGKIPEELFSRNILPSIDKNPYILTLGSYDHFWLMLHKQSDGKENGGKDLRIIRTPGERWYEFLNSSERKVFEQDVLPGYLQGRRWFGAKSRVITNVAIAEEIMMDAGGSSIILLLAVKYKDGNEEQYLSPVSFEPFHSGKHAETAKRSALCIIYTKSRHGYLYDASSKELFQSNLLALIYRKSSLKGKKGVIRGFPGKNLHAIAGKEPLSLPSRILNAEQSNTAFLFGEKLFMKLYRKLDEGTNPEIEMLKYLTDKTSFRNIPLFAGTLEYQAYGSEPITIGLLQSFAGSVSDGWKYALQTAARFYEQLLARKEDAAVNKSGFNASVFGFKKDDIPELFSEFNGGLFYDMMALLGHRTAEMHHALANARDDEPFAPETFSQLYQRSLYQSLQSLIGRNFLLLRKQLPTLAESLRYEAECVINAETELLSSARKILHARFEAQKIRIHGDYHLGQVLFTGKDFVIIDFEGEPARSIGERKLKYSCFRDVAGMVRSLHYVAYGAVFLNKNFSAKEISAVEPWIERWYSVAAGIFLNAYFKSVDGASFIPQSEEAREKMLDIFLLEKVVYELGYELNNRPTWTVIPLKGILNVKQVLKGRDT
ncbi:MAG: maltose alpha-D-glucosyltransferase [Chitinispirillaceae bacterium]|nr:maltose alpha-D-glucosyltransferase [Chitinispirillaceae bacterium]